MQTVIFGDARSMIEVADQSVHLMITSPPYWQLKDYGCEGQIGFNDTYPEYIENLNRVWDECLRVLHDGCRLCINIGDQFARTYLYGRYKVIPIRTEIIRHIEGRGADYMGAVIWRKVTTCNTSGGGTVMGSFPYPRNGILKIDYEFILIFKKLGQAPSVPSEIKKRAKLETSEWNEYFSGHWSFPGDRQDSHLAAFPVELPWRLIRMFSFPGETVLDPFLGSGTTMAAALELGRSGIGFEINRDYESVIRRKLGLETLYVKDEVRFIRREDPENQGAKAEPLESVENKSSCINRIKDPRSRRFGSVVSGRSEKDQRDGFVRTKIKEVSRDGLRLRCQDGRWYYLAGVDIPPRLRRAAGARLKDWILGKRLLLRFEEGLPKQDGCRAAYVYLSDRTFVNARLILSGLALAVQQQAYRHRKRFIKYMKESEEKPSETDGA